MRFLVLGSYLFPYPTDTAVAILADHHHLLLKTILAILNAGLSTWRISNCYVQQHEGIIEQLNFVHTGVVYELWEIAPLDCTHFEDEQLPQYLESVLNPQVKHFVNNTQ